MNVTIVKYTNINMEEERESLFILNKERLKEMAENLKERNLSPKDRILVCIDVDAIFWKPLVDLLMPDYDWDVYRKQGLLPVARGKVPREGLLKALQEAYFINLESITNAELLKEDNNNYVVLSFANVGISAFNI